MSERRYSEKEVAEIMRLATEGTPKPATDGLTLAEIQNVVSELGLDPAAVESAAKRVEAGLPETNVRGTQVEFLRTFEGELDDQAWEEILLLLRRRSGTSGDTTVRGTTREWKSAVGDIEQYNLTATTHNGRTRIHLTHDVAGHIALSWIVSILPILLGPVIILSKSLKSGADMTIPIIASALIAFATFALISTYTRRIKQRSRNLESIFNEIEPLIHPTTAHPPTTVSVEEELRQRI